LTQPRGQPHPGPEVIAQTRLWIEKAVLGLGLCPFASSPYHAERIRYRVSTQTESVLLREELSDELQLLQAADPLECETTLLIHPQVLNDFLRYNAFLDECDSLLDELELDAELQIASFHPRYQFAGTSANDVGNYTNRSPYPMLHLLREASVTRAVAAYPDVDDIGGNNVATLRRLGHDGWQRLWIKQ
jgi:hypothetical protein